MTVLDFKEAQKGLLEEVVDTENQEGAVFSYFQDGEQLYLTLRNRHSPYGRDFIMNAGDADRMQRAFPGDIGNTLLRADSDTNVLFIANEVPMDEVVKYMHPMDPSFTSKTAAWIRDMKKKASFSLT
jgi:hypothetical protein